MRKKEAAPLKKNIYETAFHSEQHGKGKSAGVFVSMFLREYHRSMYFLISFQASL